MDREKTMVLGIDPGSAHVGWSMARGHEMPNYGEMAPDQFLMEMEDISDDPTSADRVAIERFDLRQFTVDAILTVELVGAIRWICRKRGIPVNFVNASNKIKFLDRVPDYITGHARDAEAIRLYDLEYGKWR